MPELSLSGSQDRLELARSGDRQALEALLADVSPALLRFGLRMCKHSADAEEAVQESLIYAAQHLKEFEGRSSLTTWLFTILRTQCSRNRRGKMRAPHASEDALRHEPSSLPTPEQHFEHAELVGLLEQGLHALEEDQREVLLLRDVEGLPAAEVAQILGISVEATKSRLHRARSTLRLRMQEQVAPPKPGCPDILAAWSKRLEGELSESDCRGMEAHVHSCESCSEACDALKVALAACRVGGGTGVPAGVQARVLKALHAVVNAPASRDGK